MIPDGSDLLLTLFRVKPRYFNITSQYDLIQNLNFVARYFRGEFTQSHVSAEKFDKEYVYGIRSVVIPNILPRYYFF